MVLLSSPYLAFVASVFVQFSQAAKNGTFYNPPYHRSNPVNSANPQWALGETQLIRWSTMLPEYSVNLVQLTQDGKKTRGPSVFRTTKETVTEFNWLVQSFQFDLEDSNIFYFAAEGESGSFTSYRFNITKAAVSSPASISTPSNTAQSAVSTPPPDPTPTDTSSSGLPRAGAIGIGVGVAVAAVLSFIILFIIYLRKKKAAGQTHELLQDDNVPNRAEMEHIDRGYLKPAEMEGADTQRSRPVEMEHVHRSPPAELA